MAENNAKKVHKCVNSSYYNSCCCNSTYAYFWNSYILYDEI